MKNCGQPHENATNGNTFENVQLQSWFETAHLSGYQFDCK